MKNNYVLKKSITFMLVLIMILVYIPNLSFAVDTNSTVVTSENYFKSSN